jgi:Domain of unknown function (DUF4157)/Lysine-specific metallo-endopeptidase
MNKHSAAQPQKASTPVHGGVLQRKCACGNHTIAGGECEECGRKKRLGLQTKLKINEPGDLYEQEADRVADQVIATPAHHTVSGAPPRIQRFSGRPNGQMDAVPVSVDQVLANSGKPLEPVLRHDMEQRFGHDFSGVRVHTGTAAEQSARDVNAHAYTVGHRMVFGAGQFAPETQAGRLLLAHELTHVMQQSGAAEIRRDPADETRALPDDVETARTPRPTAPAAPYLARQAAPQAPKFGKACSGGPTDPCQLARCSPTQQSIAVADIARGLGYVNASIAALAANPLSGFTSRAMDWYFGGHDATTVATVSTRLGCIGASLSSAPGRYGCDPNDSALGYTCAGGAGICGHLAKDICFTSKHFGRDDHGRAIVAVHEASHLEGMSTGSSRTNPDIYENEMRFLDMPPSQAVQNADSYALFAAAIGTNHLPGRVLFVMGAGGGVALSSVADPTWYFHGTLGFEYQHPRLRLFNPSLSLGLTLIGEAENPKTGVRGSQSTLLSVLGGLRFGPARRPGAGGSLELSLFGGPALSLTQPGSSDIGVVAGIAVGYRWRMLDVSVGAGYAYDPGRTPGLEHTATVGGTFTINLFH